MTTQFLTAEQIRREGFRVLVRELGAAGAIRFMQQFDRGQGDYTEGRAQKPERDMEYWVAEMSKVQQPPVG